MLLLLLDVVVVCLAENELTENNIKAGDDVVVMVVNEGEIDLYLNFACSCQQNNVTIKVCVCIQTIVILLTSLTDLTCPDHPN